MKLKWHGHSCFEITLNDGTVIVTDPYDGTVGYPPLDLRADIVLSSHDHFDHNHFDDVSGTPRILSAPGEYGIGPARITGVDSFHDDAAGEKRGRNTIFRLEADGLSLAHLGDLGHLPDTEAQAAALAGLDAMLIPIGGFFTIDTPQAVEIIRRFRPRAAIAMHFKNRWCGFPISDESAFLELTGGDALPNEIELTASGPEGCHVMRFA